MNKQMNEQMNEQVSEPADEQMGEPETENTPESQGEEQQLDRYLQVSGEIIKRMKDPVVNAVRSGNASQVLLRVIDKIESSVPEGLSDLVRFFGGIGALEQIAVLAEKYGVKNFGPEERMAVIREVLAAKVEEYIKGGGDPHEMLAAAKAAESKLAGGA